MIKNKDLLERIDQIIRFKKTGNPKEFAEYLQISERQLYRAISYMKEMGCPIMYDACNSTYKYEVDGYLSIKFQEKNNNKKPDSIIHTEELKRIKGGFVKNNLLTDGRWQ
jgi:hypothetical protein